MRVPEIVRLRDENETLRARVAQLEQMFAGLVYPQEWSLSKSEEQLIAVLYRRSAPASMDLLIEALWSHLNRDEPENPTAVIRAFVLRVRRKLGDAAIETRWGLGYQIGAETRAVLAALNARAA